MSPPPKPNSKPIRPNPLVVSLCAFLPASKAFFSSGLYINGVPVLIFKPVSTVLAVPSPMTVLPIMFTGYCKILGKLPIVLAVVFKTCCPPALKAVALETAPPTAPIPQRSKAYIPKLVNPFISSGNLSLNGLVSTS